MMNDQLRLMCDEIEKTLATLVPCGNVLTDIVSDASKYSLSAGGKRLRPVLMRKFYEMCGGKQSDALCDIFCTIELVHTFSLIHDDLPCMDDDDFRRGRPSCHKAYPEAIALLAGDALEALPFEIIADKAEKGDISHSTAVKLVKSLSHAIGIEGMIGGQVIDMMSENTEISKETLDELQSKKTGALICCACEMGCILAGADSKIPKAREYAKRLGLAFQIRDDILDVTGSFEELGKPIGSDSEQSKATYVTLFGLDKAEEICKSLTDEAVMILSEFDDSDFLRELTISLADRKK